MKRKIIGIFFCMLLIITAIPATDSSIKSPTDALGVNIPLTNTRTIWTEMQNLIADDGATGDCFGVSVSLDDDTAFIGAWGDDDWKGSAYVFTRTGSTWAQQQKLVASDGATDDEFGFSVSLDGDTAFIGSKMDDDNGENSGSVYVFIRTGTTWTQQQKLIASDGEPGEQFGISVSLDGDTALIGAPGDYNCNGSVYVFTRTGATWTQQQKFTFSGSADNDCFGIRTALDGDTALIGADDEVSQDSSGAVFVFTRSGTIWTQQQKLTPPNGAPGDLFALVSLDGDTALIGAPGRDDSSINSGSAYVFVRSGTIWTKQATLLASDGAARDYFGWCVSLDNDTVIIGAFQDDDNGGDSGSAYVFTRIGTIWTQQQKLVAGDGAQGDQFGYSVSLDSDTALIGAIRNDDNGVDSGSAYVFTRIGGIQPVANFSWTPLNPAPSQQISFDASASYDTDGTITLYEWDWDNDGVFDEAESSPKTTHSWAYTGSYPVTVRVTDDEGLTGTITKTVNVSITVQIDITGGLGVHVVMTNKGTFDVNDVAWQISVKGGILGQIEKTVNGTIDIITGESTTVGTGLFFGFGAISIIVKVENEEQTTTGTQFIIFSMVKKQGILSSLVSLFDLLKAKATNQPL
jgi:hypothetical protein